jgi:hypothetical protein
MRTSGHDTETGTVGNANVTNVVVTCRTRSFSIGGTVSGLQGSGLVLQKNGSDDIAIASNGQFTVPDGAGQCHGLRGA